MPKVVFMYSSSQNNIFKKFAWSIGDSIDSSSLGDFQFEILFFKHIGFKNKFAPYLTQRGAF